MDRLKMDSPGELSQYEICSDLDAEECRHLTGYLLVEERESGEWLFRQNEPGDALYLVESGALTIYVNRVDGKELALAAFEAGSFFGEMALIDGEPRSAGCRAESASRLLSLDRDAFNELTDAHPVIAYKIMRRMVIDTKNRLTNTNSFLSDLVRLGEAARKRAITDDLTGLYNRRYLDDTLESMVERAGGTGSASAFSLVMIDLDRFSSINDEYGQAKGDEVLKAVVEVFTSSLREGDIAARYGGDEFNLILPATDPWAALDICNTLCEKVAALDVLAGLGGSMTRVTTSQGIATFPEDGSATETIREAADAALYRAKEAGRNCVRHAGVPDKA